MSAFTLMLNQLWGLFVDDGYFALAILGVVLFACALTFVFHVQPSLVGAFVAMGCVIALIDSVLRGARYY
jgi:hypothetical protein